jgi:ubiquinone/menaquinone biosynthesis C-methylase UbiE
MKTTPKEIAEIIIGMRQAYSKGGNAMEWCRDYFRTRHKTVDGNNLLATLVAYDLQAGSYLSAARAHRENNQRWCRQLAGLLAGVLDEGDSIMEVGVGEATTLAGVLAETGAKVSLAFGFDVSWSRVAEGRKWLAENGQEASLFVADLLNIPLADGSVDVVYSSHSLEPNRGKEEEALRERLRILVERHLLMTGSARARALLEDWDAALPRFVKVMPRDYRRALLDLKAEQAGGVAVAAE